MKQPLKLWHAYWAPEGRCIARIEATTIRQAIRKVPLPYRRHKAEVYLVDMGLATRPDPPLTAREQWLLREHMAPVAPVKSTVLPREQDLLDAIMERWDK